MSLNLIGCDRGQLLLMPPLSMDWPSENQFVWTILGAFEQIDLETFEVEYRLGAPGWPA
jgi:hypothetical protein